MSGISVHSKGITNWNPQGAHIERFMENAAYTSAHPDDTLILVGPSRFADLGVTPGGDAAAVSSAIDNLIALGMVQSMQVSQQRNVTPVQAIGSGRNYFMAGKSLVNFNIARLYAKGNNLQRALYRGVIKDENVNSFNPFEPAASTNADGEAKYALNMDSEMFLIPFGMCMVFRDKSNASLGGFYMESCMIQSYQLSVVSGQNVIMDNVSGMCDRMFPIDIGSQVGNFFRDGNAVTVPANTADPTGNDLANGRLAQ